MNANTTNFAGHRQTEKKSEEIQAQLKELRQENQKISKSSIPSVRW